ncbi:IclR family transcriptional regulator [Sporosarcina highlanderae]|uniref:IclR family transcriptional regulator n=1 Tax=Sporosarcina highlanderae TaxID=3035916 RepID=A0ABT8JVQ9_9BACL|nr:IclR family transcriptional regulator [Sporosarcina highlanderae]MDN4609169.1 IclR family transcriptional regulator [Sporosarcina highlanderae]
MKKSNSEVKETLSSVDRVLMILDYLSTKRSGASLSELSKELNIPKTTAFRILETLTQRDYIEFENATEKYSIGLTAITMSMNALSNMNIVEVTIPYLKELASKTEETTFLGVYNEGQIIYLYKKEGTRSILMNSQLGSRRDVHSTGLGKAILSGFPQHQVTNILEEYGMRKMTENTITDPIDYISELDKVRINGYAMDNEEFEKGLGCYAAPIYNYEGKAVAAICVSGPIERIIQNKEVLVTELKEAVDQISRRMGFVPSMLVQ